MAVPVDAVPTSAATENKEAGATAAPNLEEATETSLFVQPELPITASVVASHASAVRMNQLSQESGFWCSENW